MIQINELKGGGVYSKIAGFVSYVNTCMFCTRGLKFPFNTRPMDTAKVDEDGNFWFISSKYSNKNKDILRGSSVQLIYSQPGDTHFLSIYGSAAIITDRYKLEEVWNPKLNVWFQQGIDDPDITLIKVLPIEVQYWNSRLGKMIPLMNIPDLPVGGRHNDGVMGRMVV